MGNLDYIKAGLSPCAVGITTAPLAAKTFEAAMIHPIVTKLCRNFRDGAYAAMLRQKLKNKKDQERIAKSFFQGAYELQYEMEGGTGANAYAANGELNPDSPLGALALFIGGNMYRQGAMDAIRGVWAIIDQDAKRAEADQAREAFAKTQEDQ